MSQLDRTFYQNSDGLIAQFVRSWGPGRVYAHGDDEKITTAIATASGLMLGRVITLPFFDYRVPLYLLTEVERLEGARGVDGGVGTFLAFQAWQMMEEWAREVDKVATFDLVLQTPVGKGWSRFRRLLNLTQTVILDGQEMPVRRYGV